MDAKGKGKRISPPSSSGERQPRTDSSMQDDASDTRSYKPVTWRGQQNLGVDNKRLTLVSDVSSVNSDIFARTRDKRSSHTRDSAPPVPKILGKYHEKPLGRGGRHSFELPAREPRNPPDGEWEDIQEDDDKLSWVSRDTGATSSVYTTGTTNARKDGNSGQRKSREVGANSTARSHHGRLPESHASHESRSTRPTPPAQDNGITQHKQGLQSKHSLQSVAFTTHPSETGSRRGRKEPRKDRPIGAPYANVTGAGPLGRAPSLSEIREMDTEGEDETPLLRKASSRSKPKKKKSFLSKVGSGLKSLAKALIPRIPDSAMAKPSSVAPRRVKKSRTVRRPVSLVVVPCTHHTRSHGDPHCQCTKCKDRRESRDRIRAEREEHDKDRCQCEECVQRRTRRRNERKERRAHRAEFGESKCGCEGCEKRAGERKGSKDQKEARRVGKKERRKGLRGMKEEMDAEDEGRR